MGTRFLVAVMFLYSNGSDCSLIKYFYKKLKYCNCLIFTGQYFHEFHEKVVRGNIIVNILNSALY